MSFETNLKRRADQIGDAIQDAMQGAYPGGDFWDAALYAASGGKRLRGFLVLESAALHDIPVTRAMPAAIAIEAIHAYSLVHDDLPCMDDDDLRRGKPTVHKKWDEATAVLAGDALQSFAFESLARSDLPADRLVELIHSLARAAGGSGIDMVGCHHGIIKGNYFENMGSNSIQAKGGTQHITIEGNFFRNGGQRPLNLGGSTGLPFFRPIDATFEAADIKVFSNIIVGS